MLSAAILLRNLQGYRIYPKYSDTSTPYYSCPKIQTRTIYCPMLCLKNYWMSGKQCGPNETPRSAASHLGLHCLLRLVCPNTYGKYSNVLKVEADKSILELNLLSIHTDDGKESNTVCKGRQFKCLPLQNCYCLKKFFTHY